MVEMQLGPCSVWLIWGRLPLLLPCVTLCTFACRIDKLQSLPFILHFLSNAPPGTPAGGGAAVQAGMAFQGPQQVVFRQCFDRYNAPPGTPAGGGAAVQAGMVYEPAHHTRR